MRGTVNVLSVAKRKKGGTERRRKGKKEGRSKRGGRAGPDIIVLQKEDYRMGSHERVKLRL